MGYVVMCRDKGNLKLSARKLYLGQLFVCLMLSLPQAVLARGEEFPPPPGSQVSWVSKDMMLNGMPMAVRHFKSERSVDEVLRYYRQLWRSPVAPELPGYKEAGQGPWQVISRLDAGYFRTVQVQNSDKGSWGYLGETDNSQAKKTKVKKVGTGFPKMRNSQVLNDLVSSDPGKAGRTMLIRNSFSTRANAGYYRSHYLNAGWKALADNETDNTWVQTFKKGANQVSLVIRKDQGFTVIVANEVKEGLFR